MNDDPDERLSRTRRKRDAEALQAIGERLLAMPEAKLAALPLPPALLDAVRTGRKLNQRGAQRRQRQYIGRLMREIDSDELLAALAFDDRREHEEHARFHACEQWRERLLEEGMPALEEFFDQHPSADRQRLRQLLQAARTEEKSDRSPRHRRELFRALRDVLDDGL